MIFLRALFFAFVLITAAVPLAFADTQSFGYFPEKQADISASSENNPASSDNSGFVIFSALWIGVAISLCIFLFRVYQNKKGKAVPAGAVKEEVNELPIFDSGQLILFSFLLAALVIAFIFMFLSGMVFSMFLWIGAVLMIWRLFPGLYQDIFISFKHCRLGSVKNPHDVPKEKTTFNDVGGHDEVVKELKYVVWLYKNPEEAKNWDIRPPSGILLSGPAGTGKTLIARATAGETGFNFLSYSGAEIGDRYVRSGAGAIKEIFEEASEKAPCVVFFDEIDALGRRRGQDTSGEFDHALNQLLHEMDGFNKRDGVILLGATNREDVLDEALLRPGRFDKRFVIGLPDVKGRHKILLIHTAKKRLAKDINPEEVALQTPGFSGADLAQLVNEATQLAQQRYEERKKEMGLLESVKESVIGVFSEEKVVKKIDFSDAMDKISAGLEKNLVMSDEEKKIVAWHEMGHAIVTKVKGLEVLKKVALTPRHRALGMTLTQAQDRRLYSKELVLARITMLLGGRAAEEIFLGEDRKTSGGEDDFEKAAGLARKAVSEWGMGEFGPAVYHKLDGGRRYLSERMAYRIDKEIWKIMLDCLEDAKRIILERKETVDRLAEKLVEKTVLEAEEIDRMIADFEIASN